MSIRFRKVRSACCEEALTLGRFTNCVREADMSTASASLALCPSRGAGRTCRGARLGPIAAAWLIGGVAILVLTRSGLMDRAGAERVAAERGGADPA